MEGKNLIICLGFYLGICLGNLSALPYQKAPNTYDSLQNGKEIEIALRQITYAAGQGADGSPFIGQPSVSADGKRIVFTSNRDLTGDNPDLNNEVFLWTEGLGLTQITVSTGGDSIDPPVLANAEPHISGDGHTVVFTSNRDLIGENKDGTREVFMWKADIGVSQITNSEGGGENANLMPTINQDGTKITFVSNRNLTGANTDGNHEIFLWEQDTLFQVTDSGGGESPANSHPSISADGARIAFSSNRDLVGSNGDHTRQIFLWTRDGDFTQITNSVGGDDYTNIEPSLSADSRAVAFSSKSDLTANNSNRGYEIFRWSERSGLTRVTTCENGDSRKPSISANGSSIAFSSNCDVSIGTNPELKREIFSAWREIFWWNERVGLLRITNSLPDEEGRQLESPYQSFSYSTSLDAAGTKVVFDINPDVLQPSGHDKRTEATGISILHHDASHDIFIGDLSSPD